MTIIINFFKSFKFVKNETTSKMLNEIDVFLLERWTKIWEKKKKTLVTPIKKINILNNVISVKNWFAKHNENNNNFLDFSFKA